MANGWLNRKIQWKHIPAILFCAVLSGNLVALMSEYYWFFALADHFRWHYLALSLIGFVGTVIWRQWRLLIFFFVLMGYNTWIISPWVWGPDDSTTTRSNDDRSKNSLIWMNVSTGNNAKDQVLQYLKESNPDLILLGEVNQSWIDALNPLSADWSIQLIQSREDNFGMAVYAKKPFLEHEILMVDGLGVPCIHAVFQSEQGKDVSVFAIHPVPPIGSRYTSFRDAYLSFISDHLSEMERPSMLVGDFNATPWHYPVKRLRQQHSLNCNVPSPLWTQNTWPSGLLPVGIPIDLCLSHPEVTIWKITRGPDLGSDHRPLEIVFSIP